jgi:hypothetical protein
MKNAIILLLLVVSVSCTNTNDFHSQEPATASLAGSSGENLGKVVSFRHSPFSLTLPAGFSQCLPLISVSKNSGGPQRISVYNLNRAWSYTNATGSSLTFAGAGVPPEFKKEGKKVSFRGFAAYEIKHKWSRRILLDPSGFSHTELDKGAQPPMFCIQLECRARSDSDYAALNKAMESLELK